MFSFWIICANSKSNSCPCTCSHSRLWAHGQAKTESVGNSLHSVFAFDIFYDTLIFQIADIHPFQGFDSVPYKQRNLNIFT
jgi:hypothetical protein